MNDPFTIEMEEATGELVMHGHYGFKEPICPVCHEPIGWVLDMMSMTKRDSPSGKFVMCHARCVWTKNGFRQQEKMAPK